MNFVLGYLGLILITGDSVIINSIWFSYRNKKCTIDEDKNNSDNDAC